MPSRSSLQSPRLAWRVSLVAAAALSWGCAQTVADGGALREQVVAVTASHELITFNAGRPDNILERKPVLGKSLVARATLVVRHVGDYRQQKRADPAAILKELLASTGQKS